MDRTPVGEPPDDRPLPDELSRGVKRVAVWLGSGRDCVPRALAVFSILTRNGYQVSFVSGVRVCGDDLRSHAWVEVDGTAVPRGSDTDGVVRYIENFRHTSGDAARTGAP